MTRLVASKSMQEAMYIFEKPSFQHTCLRTDFESVLDASGGVLRRVLKVFGSSEESWNSGEESGIIGEELGIRRNLGSAGRSGDREHSKQSQRKIRQT